NKVLKYVKTFTEVRGNRRFDNRTVRLGHQAPHTSQLANLGSGTPGAGVSHHVDGVERFLAHGFAVTIRYRFSRQLFHHGLADFIARLAPDIDHVVVTLLRGHQTGRILLVDLFDFFAGLGKDFFLDRRYQHVAHGDRNPATSCQAETGLHQLVGENHRGAQTAATERLVDQARNFFLFQRTVQHRKRQAVRQDFRQQRAANCGFEAFQYRLPFALLVFLVFVQTNGNATLQLDFTVIVGALHFSHVGEEQAFAFAVDAFTRRVVQPKHDILRRHDGRFAVGREQNVVGGQHQCASFQLGLQRQWHVNGHLVTVEVGVKCSANQRMQLNCLTFDKDRFKCLDAQTVQRRRTVQHDRVFADNLFEDVPNHWFLRFYQFLGGLDCRCQAHHFQTIENERLEQFERHQLGQTALVQLELRAHHNNRTAGVVDALAQQVLTE